MSINKAFVLMGVLSGAAAIGASRMQAAQSHLSDNAAATIPEQSETSVRAGPASSVSEKGSAAGLGTIAEAVSHQPPQPPSPGAHSEHNGIGEIGVTSETRIRGASVNRGPASGAKALFKDVVKFALPAPGQAKEHLDDADCISQNLDNPKLDPDHCVLPAPTSEPKKAPAPTQTKTAPPARGPSAESTPVESKSREAGGSKEIKEVKGTQETRERVNTYHGGKSGV